MNSRSGKVVPLDSGKSLIQRFRDLDIHSDLREQLSALFASSGYFVETGRVKEFNTILNALVSSYPDDSGKIFSLFGCHLDHQEPDPCQELTDRMVDLIVENNQWTLQKKAT